MIKTTARKLPYSQCTPIKKARARAVRAFRQAVDSLSVRSRRYTE
ncbi:hypothetical protein [Microbulbifer spongiae]|nr:hypothetical protein [Microbulbifer sp. MI-G]